MNPPDLEADAQLAEIAHYSAEVIAKHERINRVHFTPEQRERIALEIPKHGTPEPTSSGHELAAYRMPNGSRFVTLSDGTEGTWRAYCAELIANNPPRF